MVLHVIWNPALVRAFRGVRDSLAVVEGDMKYTVYTPAQIATKMRRVQQLLDSGITLAEAARKVGVKYGTLYYWRRRFAEGLTADPIRRIKELERENARLRRALEEFDQPVRAMTYKAEPPAKRPARRRRVA